jgi:pilus assembly protein CpaD
MHGRLHASLLIAAATLAGACSQSRAQIGYANRDHLDLRAVERVETLELPLAADARFDGEAIDAAAHEWIDRGSGPMVISWPAGGPADGAGEMAAIEARTRLIAAGVPEGAIAEGSYDAAGRAFAPLRVSFAVHEMLPPECDSMAAWRVDSTGSNSAMPSFGCALASSVSAMIANPADVAALRPMDPADAPRRSVVLSKYRAGESTATKPPEQASGAISDAVK